MLSSSWSPASRLRRGRPEYHVCLGDQSIVGTFGVSILSDASGMYPTYDTPSLLIVMDIYLLI